eukprot:GEMP01022056.1.p1 GENE.GEMP01022056.1~~GEMP01022056.1.p1  ORF type:complete len:602 (+),score=119.73 GEMP01022056.1:83-1888(+)
MLALLIVLHGVMSGRVKADWSDCSDKSYKSRLLSFEIKPQIFEFEQNVSISVTVSPVETIEGGDFAVSVYLQNAVLSWIPFFSGEGDLSKQTDLRVVPVFTKSADMTMYPVTFPMVKETHVKMTCELVMYSLRGASTIWMEFTDLNDDDLACVKMDIEEIYDEVEDPVEDPVELSTGEVDEKITSGVHIEIIDVIDVVRSVDTNTENVCADDVATKDCRCAMGDVTNICTIGDTCDTSSGMCTASRCALPSNISTLIDHASASTCDATLEAGANCTVTCAKDYKASGSGTLQCGMSMGGLSKIPACTPFGVNTEDIVYVQFHMTLTADIEHAAMLQTDAFHTVFQESIAASLNITAADVDIRSLSTHNVVDVRVKATDRAAQRAFTTAINGNSDMFTHTVLMQIKTKSKAVNITLSAFEIDADPATLLIVTQESLTPPRPTVCKDDYPTCPQWDCSSDFELERCRKYCGLCGASCDYSEHAQTGWCVSTKKSSANLCAHNEKEKPANAATCANFNAAGVIEGITENEAQKRCTNEPRCAGYVAWKAPHVRQGAFRLVRHIHTVRLSTNGEHCIVRKCLSRDDAAELRPFAILVASVIYIMY